MLEYAVLYCSETGNTRKIAYEIFSALPGQDKDIANLEETEQIPEAKTYFIGFFVNKGTCSASVIRCLEHLGGKNIALFGTCGSIPSTDYQKTVENQVSVWIESDNDYLGMYLCQGKMPIQVRKKYEAMYTEENKKTVDRMLANFDEAMLHPDETDFIGARKFTETVLKKIRYEI